MACAALTNKSGRLYISSTPLIDDITELMTADYLIVPGLGSVGNTGIDQSVVEHSVFGADIPVPLKSDAELMEWSVEILDSHSDGRDQLDVASTPDNHNVYGVRIIWDNGDMELSLNYVKSPVKIKGISSDLRLLRYTFKPVSEIHRL